MKMNSGKIQIFVTHGECLLDWSNTCIKSLAPEFVLLNPVSPTSGLLNQRTTVIQHMAIHCINWASLVPDTLQKWKYVSDEKEEIHAIQA
jgi:hypothetical protein